MNNDDYLRYKTFIALGFHFVIACQLSMGYYNVLKDYPPSQEPVK